MGFLDKIFIDRIKDLELSVQILYRDGLTMDFWPIWES